MVSPNLFDTYSRTGLESSSHLDLIPATAHRRAVAQNHTLVLNQGIHTGRDGVRWHLIRASPGSCKVVSHPICRTSTS
jgi:hypothetical protein